MIAAVSIAMSTRYSAVRAIAVLVSRYSCGGDIP